MPTGSANCRGGNGDKESLAQYTGDLVQLRSTGGNFASATQNCLAGATTAYRVTDATIPPPGGARFYLVRGVNCSAGSYDNLPGQGQVGTRDAGIAASGLGCP